MRHAIAVEGFRYRLRPLHVDDAEFMLGLRLRAGIREHVNPTSRRIEDQRAWIERCLDSRTDHSFVLDEVHGGTRTGSFSVYDHEASRRRARIGRWLVRPGSRCVPEFALLGYSACFEALGLDRVYCRIPGDNVAALAFQRRIGSAPRGEIARVDLNGRDVGLLEFELTATAWPSIRDALNAIAEASHARTDRWRNDTDSGPALVRRSPEATPFAGPRVCSPRPSVEERHATASP